ncbi:MAG: T9SS type A sorting domain-containing protein [Chitinophagaceae bacterium]
MKTLLRLYLLLLASVSFSASHQIYGQACTVSNITVTLNSALTNAGNCQVNIDLSWDQQNNGGNKYTNLHIWSTANYPGLSYANPPTLSDLANAIGTIVIANPTTATPTLNATYPNAPATTMLSAASVQKVYVSGSGINTINRFTIKGIVFTAPGSCSNPVSIKADIWSSNSNSDNAVQCADPNHQFFVNNPLVSGSLICSPRQFNVSISNLSNVSQQAVFTVYADDVFPGTLDAADPVLYTSGTITLPASGVYTSGGIAYSTYPLDNVWVRVQVTGNTYSTTTLIINGCPNTLPVGLLSFNGARQSNSSVLLKWETAFEANNKGFEIQRKTGEGNFQAIGFVSSSARDGNSNSLLTYQFVDANSSGDLTQYRLAQTDIDNKQTLSNIIIIKGNKTTGMAVVVYPNPSPDGKVKLLFSDTEIKDIKVIDNTGKIVQLKRSVTASCLDIAGLQSGMYFLSVTLQSTGESVIKKVVVR